MFRFLPALLLFISSSYAQWSTSTRAESTLYVCPGFYPGIVTFDDGSSIVLGALNSYIYARKLDDRGYYLWPPIQVMHNDSSFVTETPLIGDWGGWISDGDGGVILFWYDHRGAYISGPDWANNSIYVQRVDRFGTVRWRASGVHVKGPETGLKKGGIVNDGQGGCVIAWVESEFGFPGAQNRERTRILRISNMGSAMWERVLDSSNTQYSIVYRNVVRAQDRFFFLSSVGTRILTLDGSMVNETPISGHASMVSERDSVLYVLSGIGGLRILKLDTSGDTLWNTPLAVRPGCEGVVPFRRGALTPDGMGGIYYLYSCQDTIYHVNSLGQPSRVRFPGIASQVGGYAFADGEHGLVLANEAGRAQRFYLNGNQRWGNSIIYIVNPGETYFDAFEGDKNGGVIVAFWTTLGGIFSQHTGRNGNVGLISTSAIGSVLPAEMRLQQNFPNPFNTMTTIVYSLNRSTRVRLEVFDVIGRVIAVLVDERLPPGAYRLLIDASEWSSGTYFYRLKAEDRIITTKKMLLIK